MQAKPARMVGKVSMAEPQRGSLDAGAQARIKPRIALPKVTAPKPTPAPTLPPFPSPSLPFEREPDYERDVKEGMYYASKAELGPKIAKLLIHKVVPSDVTPGDKESTRPPQWFNFGLHNLAYYQEKVEWIDNHFVDIHDNENPIIRDNLVAKLVIIRDNYQRVTKDWSRALMSVKMEGTMTPRPWHWMNDKEARAKQQRMWSQLAEKGFEV